MKILFPCVLLCLLTLAGCGGGGNDASPTSGGLLSGNWQMELQLTPTSMKTESGFLMQSGNSITGSVLIAGETDCAGLGSAQGQIKGSDVTINVSQIAQTIQLTGTASAEGTSITGDYAILASGCGSTQTGTWTASRVAPLSGNFTGTFTSEQISGLTYDGAGTVDQGPNTASSTTTVTGTMTSTKSPCFTNISFSGLIGGTSVVFNLVDQDGNAVGQYRPTLTLDGKTMTGVYQFNPVPHVCSGDYGMATMTLQ